MTDLPARSIRTPLRPADSCSLLNAEPLAGTASTEKLWVALEHPGGWGKDVLDGSVFGDELSAALSEKMKDAGARFLLIRKPGREGQIATDTPRKVFIAQAELNLLYEMTVEKPEDLLELSLNQPEFIPGIIVKNNPLALVCAHSKRDRCCAIVGRPIAGELAAEHPGDAWECSHTGGHRFAPVSIMLPSGYTYGRLTADNARAAFGAMREGEAPALDGLRGRSMYAAPEQAAEIAVRELLAEGGEFPLVSHLNVSRETQTATGSFSANLGSQIDQSTQDATLTYSRVTHLDGRRWLVSTRVQKLPEVYASCGKAPKAGKSVEVLEARPI